MTGRLIPILLTLLLAGANTLPELMRRAEKGDGEALYHLAMLYDTGCGTIRPDTARSTALYIRAAEAGNIEAQNYLGYRLYKGEGAERDPEQALQWLETAAMAGSAKAASNLGFLLLEGENVVHDAANAAYWLSRAADAGVASAQSMLGDLYQLGKGVEKSLCRADSLYQLAFEAGLPDAGIKLYQLREPRYTSLSADSLTAEGLYFYTRSLASPAVRIFERGAKMGDPQALALMGDAYTRALGVGYDHRKALDCYASAAAEGYAPAMFIIAELLEIFPDAVSDLSPPVAEKWKGLPTDAAYWMERARQGGIADAKAANKALFDY